MAQPADLSQAAAGFAQLQVRFARSDRPLAHPQAARSLPVWSSPTLQAAFGKGDVAACKQLLSRLKVRQAANACGSVPSRGGSSATYRSACVPALPVSPALTPAFPAPQIA